VVKPLIDRITAPGCAPPERQPGSNGVLRLRFSTTLQSGRTRFRDVCRGPRRPTQPSGRGPASQAAAVSLRAGAGDRAAGLTAGGFRGLLGEIDRKAGASS